MAELLSLSLAEVLAAFKSGDLQLLDIRENEEWQQSRVEGAVHYPLSEMELGENPPNSVDTNVQTYIYCRRGNRVRKARYIMQAIGFAELGYLDESFSDLSEAGFPIAKKG